MGFQVRNSDKLKEIMKKILYLGNTLNQGTARGIISCLFMRILMLIFFLMSCCYQCCIGSAVGFRLDSLLKLTDTRATNNKMTLMHYLCKVWSFVKKDEGTQYALQDCYYLISDWNFKATFHTLLMSFRSLLRSPHNFLISTKNLSAWKLHQRFVNLYASFLLSRSSWFSWY